MRNILILAALAAAFIAHAQAVPVPGTKLSLSGVAGLKMPGGRGFAATVADLNAYRFTAVPVFRWLDLHLFTGVGDHGRVVGGGSLGRSFRLADQADAFVAAGAASIQGQTGWVPVVEAGLEVRF